MGLFSKKPKSLDPQRAGDALATFARRELTDQNPFDPATTNAMRVVQDAWFVSKSDPGALASLFEDLLAVASAGGWRAVGVWRFAALCGADSWRGDERLARAFLAGLRDVLSGADASQIRYQADAIEEELIRSREARGTPPWKIVPLRGMDMVETATPAPGQERAVDELAIGQERLIARFDHGNQLIVVREPNSHVAQLRYGDGGGYDYARAAGLFDVLRAVGEQIGRQRPAWVSPDLDPYITERPPR